MGFGVTIQEQFITLEGVVENGIAQALGPLYFRSHRFAKMGIYPATEMEFKFQSSIPEALGQGQYLALVFAGFENADGKDEGGVARGMPPVPGREIGKISPQGQN